MKERSLRFQLILPCVLAIATCTGQTSAFAHIHHFESRTESDSSSPDTMQQDERAESKKDGHAWTSRSGPTKEAFWTFRNRVSTRADGDYLLIECDGLPEHGMMVGIRSWQQQVPLPQPFVGDNAWRLPLNPRPAPTPISVLDEPLRGAIALAVNGVPIFCALNNRGEDTFLAGELDQWGGHCGRGDDYHYHIAPVHLEDRVGIGNPIAFGLDGYPILGLLEIDGTEPTSLDAFNGHEHDGAYHYHASNSFPYVNGGLRGAVTMDGDQIRQPRDSPVRPGQSPLRGATITGFNRDGDRFQLEYDLNGARHRVEYAVLDDQEFRFTFTGADGSKSSEIFRRGRGTGAPMSVYVVTVFVFLFGAGGLLFAIKRRFSGGENAS